MTDQQSADRQAEPGSGNHIPEPEQAHLTSRNTANDEDDDREATELHETNVRRPSRVLEPKIISFFTCGMLRQPINHETDHRFQANERTFLAYVRTSVALSMLGVVVAQLYRLQHSPTPSPVFGFYILGKPLAATLHCSALGMVLLGSASYFRQQMAMARGKVHACGWEVLTIMCSSLLLLIALFALHVGVDVYKDIH